MSEADRDRAECEYVRDLERIRGSGDLDEIGRDPGAIRTFIFCALAAALCLVAYFVFVASR